MRTTRWRAQPLRLIATERNQSQDEDREASDQPPAAGHAYQAKQKDLKARIELLPEEVNSLLVVGHRLRAEEVDGTKCHQHQSDQGV